MTQAQPHGKERRLEAEDLFRLDLLTEATIAPDAGQICFVKEQIDREENAYRSHLYLIEAEGGEARRLTEGEHRDFAPTFSPDGGRIAFLSTRSGEVQLWIIPTEGGEPVQITRVEGVTGRPVWSPDGRRIALIISLGPEGLTTVEEGEEREERQPPRERYTGDVQRIDSLPFKLNGVGLLGDTYLQIAVVEAEPDSLPTVLTDAELDHTSPTWSPDGEWLAFAYTTTQMEEDVDPRRLLTGDIGLIPARGGEACKLTRSLGPAERPAFSPDGKLIAYLGHALQHGTYTQRSLWVVPVDGGEPVDLTAAFDRPFGDLSIGDIMAFPGPEPRPVWSPDGRHLFHLVSDSGMVHLVRVVVKSGEVQRLTTGRRVIYHFDFDREAKRAALCQSDPLTPGDLVLLTLEPGLEERRLTQLNRELLAELRLTAPQRYTFRSGEVTAEGWMLRPPGATGRDKTPAVLQVHGGPMVMYGYRFFFEFHLLAAQGFTVVYTNPRGSMGYGQAFTAAIRGDWGRHDYHDVMAGIEAALKRGEIEPERVAIAGGSYGGYLVNWALGQTDRFCTGIAMRSIANLYSYFGTSDTGFTTVLEWGGPPWELPGRYLERSPITYVERVKAPLLLIHAELDQRVPLGQAEEFFSALKYLDREVVLRLYPGESHGFSRSGEPWHRLDRLEAIVGWLKERL
ncbi:MAG: S9 family peptidase [Bacillota bacterium]